MSRPSPMQYHRLSHDAYSRGDYASARLYFAQALEAEDREQERQVRMRPLTWDERKAARAAALPTPPPPREDAPPDFSFPTAGQSAKAENVSAAKMEAILHLVWFSDDLDEAKRQAMQIVAMSDAEALALLEG